MSTWKCLVQAGILAATLVASTNRVVWSINASPHPFTVAQPDGTTVELIMKGDEYYHWMETTDGYSVIRAENGVYHYADLNAVGALIDTGNTVGGLRPQNLRANLRPAEARVVQMRQTAHEALHGVAPEVEMMAAQDRAVRARTGTLRNLVVLMRFTNHAGRTLPTRADVDVIFNAVGGDPVLAPTGSVRDAYTEYSYGQLTIDSTVADWVDLPESEQHYADGDSALPGKIDDAIVDALELVDPDVDFNDFDQDGDGFVDGIAFLHSGYGAEWGGVDVDGVDEPDRIWSHQGSISTWTSDEGVKVREYHINPSLWGTSGSAPGRIGVICHETGHFLGMPDLYCSISGAGIGSWCLMANSWGFDGSQRRPPHPSAWCKKELGWVTPTILSAPGVYQARNAENNQEIYQLNDGFPAGEYLLIENRQPLGHDVGIPAGIGGRGGLAIWHVDEAQPGRGNFDVEPGFPGQAGWPTNGKHYKVALLQADGEYDLEQFNPPRGDALDVFRKGFRSKLTPETTPNTNAYQGGNIVVTGHRITGISRSRDVMSFRFNLPFPEAAEAYAAFPRTTIRRPQRIRDIQFNLEDEMFLHVTAEADAQLRYPTRGKTFVAGLSRSPTPALASLIPQSVRRFRIDSSKGLSGPLVGYGATFPAGEHRLFLHVIPVDQRGAILDVGPGNIMVEAFGRTIGGDLDPP
jgi:M6 family metalloprotease-like protein